MAHVNMDNVARFLEQVGWTPAKFAREMKLSQPYVYRIVHGQRAPGMTFVKALIDAGMDPRDIFATEPERKRAVF